MERLNILLQYAPKGKLVLFIGAGLSKIAGCQDWDTVIQKLSINPNMCNNIELDLENNKTLSNEDIIDFYETKYKEFGLEKEDNAIIRKAIIPDYIIRYSKNYIPLLKEIKKITPLPKIVTINIDNNLEVSKLFPLNNIFYEINDLTISNLQLNNFAIFHIHGYYEAFKQMILPTIKYSLRYSNNTFIEFLKYLFSNFCVLFLGCSLRDSRINEIMRVSDKNYPHFALLKDDKIPKVNHKLYRSLYNLNIIEYGDNHADFPLFLTKWINTYLVKIKIPHRNINK